jgi:Protein of unknown function (DUF2800)
VSKKTAIAIVPVEPAHAKLSASGSAKWLTCTPSARLEDKFPNEDTSFSKEGTFGHAVFEHRLSIYLGRDTEYMFEDKIPGHAEFWSQELSDSVGLAVDVALEHIEEARLECADPIILLEQRLDFSQWVPEGFGTGDMLIITNSYTKVLDLKMGKGIAVDAAGNSQFRLYMLGAYHTYGHLYDIQEVRGVVLQPRLNNWSTETLEVDELLNWAQQVVIPAAMSAWAGTGDFVAGDHCSSSFCRARFTCRARAEHNLEVARQDFAMLDPELMTDAQIAKVLTKADDAIKWLNDCKSYALTQATTKGAKFDGFKLVEGRSNRVISNPDELAKRLIAAGTPEAVLYERSMLGLTALEKAVGKKVLASASADLITKPPGKPVLVPLDDKREAINSTASAIADFS